MATKTINGSYPTGYALSSSFQTLNISASASVAGSGVTTVSSQTSTINNLGSVHGSTNGISLAGGGTITNGSSTNSSALIEGTKPITASKSASIVNYASIKSDATSSGYFTTFGPSISLSAGGSVDNKSTGTIGNGIAIAGAAGSVTNDGTIGGPQQTYISDQYFNTVFQGPSVQLKAGGVVTNGSEANTAAVIKYGIATQGAYATVDNFGSIASTNTPYYPITRYNGFNTGYGIVMSRGGKVTNGSETDTAASIEGFTMGIRVSGGRGTVVNFGTIGGTYYPRSSYGIEFDAGGSVTNGSATDTKATIYGQNGGIYMSGAGEYVTNFGTIDGGGSAAIQFKSSGGRLIEEGTGILLGDVLVPGGTIELAGDAGAGTFTGIGSSHVQTNVVQIDAGASWTFTGANTFNTGGLVNLGTLINRGTLTNNASDGNQTILSGKTINSGTIANTNAKSVIVFVGDFSITTDPSFKTGSFSNAGTVQKNSGTGTSIIRTGASGTLTSTGKINILSGTIELTGASVSVSGTIQGAGTIEFSTGSTTLTSTGVTTGGFLLAGSGAHLTLGKSLSYVGKFAQSANTELTINNTLTLSLRGTASFMRGLVDGQGMLSTTGATSLAGATVAALASWSNGGTVTETGQLTLSTSRTTGFNNLKGGVFNLAGNVGINATTATRFYNSGLLKKTAGSSGAVAVAVTNNGTVEAGSGLLDLQGAITGTGKLQIDSGKLLQLDSSVAAGQTVVFQGTNDRLILTDAPDFAGTLSGFGGTDKLDLTQFGAGSTLSYAANAKGTGGTLTVQNGSLLAHIALAGQYAAAGFSTASDGKGGSFVSYASPPAAAATSSSRAAAAAPMGDFAHALFDAAFASGGIAAVGADPVGHAASAATMAASAELAPKTAA